MAAVDWVVGVLGGYAVVGMLFAVVFVTTWIHRFDSLSKSSGIGFRLIVFPGAAVLWPALLSSLLRQRNLKQEHRGGRPT